MAKVKLTREQLIDRMADAYTYHRKYQPKLATREYVKDLAIKFGLHWKTVETALRMAAEKGMP